jgi:hypothetical protein
MIDYGAIFLYGFSTGLGVVFAQEFYNIFLRGITHRIFNKIKSGELVLKSPGDNDKKT